MSDYSQQIALIIEAVREATNEIAETQRALRAHHVVQRAKVTRGRGKDNHLIWYCWVGTLSGHAVAPESVLCNGVYGTGNTPAEACTDFDHKWERAWEEGQ